MDAFHSPVQTVDRKYSISLSLRSSQSSAKTTTRDDMYMTNCASANRNCRSLIHRVMIPVCDYISADDALDMAEGLMMEENAILDTSVVDKANSLILKDF